MIRRKCPHCGKALSMDDAKAGKNVKCPECSEVFRIPNNQGAGSSKAPTQPAEEPAEAAYALESEEETPPPTKKRKVAGDRKVDRHAADRGSDTGQRGKIKKRAPVDRQSRVGLPARELLGLAVFNAFLLGMGLVLLGLSLVLNEGMRGKMTADERQFAVLGCVASAIGLIWFSLIGYGMWHMKKLTSHQWAMTGTILAILTAVTFTPTGIWLLTGLWQKTTLLQNGILALLTIPWTPLGIWCLIVLLQTETKKRFRQRLLLEQQLKGLDETEKDYLLKQAGFTQE